MIRKVFFVYDENFFSVRLDASGFDESLIISSLEELNSNSKWFHIDEEEYFAADINNIEFNHDDEIISFTIRKSMLIELRKSILKSK